jgi:DNA-binding GntR family transcriptional regulator
MANKAAYEAIREGIIRGDLKPGQPITEESLSKLLNVSRTPIREALIRLESEGLVAIHKNKGAFIRQITPVDIAEILQLRVLLEGYAARACIRSISMTEVAKLQKKLKACGKRGGHHREKLALGSRIHHLIIESAGNERLRRLNEMLISQIVWVQSYASLIPGRTDRSYYEHLEILQAITDRDGDRAEAAMRKHLENTLHELLDGQTSLYCPSLCADNTKEGGRR